MSKESTIRSIIEMRCPKCHKGKLFTNSNPYNFNKVHEMPKECLYCGQPFQPEPGFYTGAMYVNYGFTLVLSGIAFLILQLLLKVPTYVFFGIYIGVLLLIGPFMFRYSRVVYLYMFVPYDKEAIEKHK
jgi:uncharacterized protein (DUF983 family)